MRILFANKYLYQKGGSENYMFSLAEGLKELGHTVEFIGMDNEKNLVGSKYTTTNLENKNIINPIRLIYSREAYKKMDLAIKEFKPDIIHINIFNFQLTTSIISAAIKNKIPVVHTIHDPQIICPNHRLFNENKSCICEKCSGGRFYNALKNKCFGGSTVKSFIGMMESYYTHKIGIYKKIALYISPSEFMKNKINEMNKDNLNIKVLYNFNNESYETKISNKKDHFTYFGRMSNEKGVDLIIKAAKELPSVNFMFCGTGPMLKDYISYCNNNKIKNINFLGFKTGKELREIISCSIATIYPSRWHENCPLSVIESKSLGIPVIGANVGGIPELIRDNIDGLLFENANYKDLKSKIELIYNDSKKQEEFSIESLNDANERFKKDKYIREIEKTLINLIDDRKLISGVR